MKTCVRCMESKSHDDFYRHNRAADGLASKCKACAKAYTRDWSRARQNHLIRRYGITQDDYQARLTEQGGVCAVCRQVCKTGFRLAVDHDHATGKVRGLLCMNCNRAIGHLQDDDPDLMLAAANYVRYFTNRHYA